ncbi:MAG: hypothetical protein J7641_03415 [Cyanobacteria bacterium SID2]|nr:hypothetical protein [Cyanobacteria bacterium SID2]MBP0004082.1 hypothetical protein [Cyanobacteria bacterium SBC]
MLGNIEAGGTFVRPRPAHLHVLVRASIAPTIGFVTATTPLSKTLGARASCRKSKDSPRAN